MFLVREFAFQLRIWTKNNVQWKGLLLEILVSLFL